MPKQHYDFSGWATRNDILCSDGRTIRHGAFSKNNGKRVPLVWNHRHDDVSEVLGHALLEERPEGIYAYCSCNSTEKGQNAKELVQHGDIVALSIYANKLQQRGGDVLHGDIKEVSLVLAGANRGALIDSVMEHGEISDDEAEIQFVGYGDIELFHAEEGEEMKENTDELQHEDDDESGETVQDVYNTLTDKQKKVVDFLITKAAGGEDEEEEEAKHSDDDQNDDGETVQDVYDTLTDKQKKVVDFLLEHAEEFADDEESEDEDNESEDEEESNEGGSESMKHNAFADGEQTKGHVLTHSEFQAIMKVAQNDTRSLKAAFEAAEKEGVIEHADGDYGVTNLDFLFPDAKTINTTPEYIKRETGWVDELLADCHHTPFSRVKSIFANITEDEARARGYIKGKYKKEEVFSLLKRTTDPQTLYKKQKLDKDDIDDIVDMNVVAWIKAEMQMMLKEETARAILIGDGRLADSDDKIREDHIRPVYNDADLFTVKVPVEVAANATSDDVAKALIKAMIKSRKLYKGSGNPKFWTTDDYVTDCLLLENGINERLYKSEAEVATAMRVKKIVPVEVMEGQKIAITENGSTTEYPLIGVEVNFADYNIGTNGGAKTDFFDGFDLDFNQYKYLYETRMSGALIKPFSAISFYLKRAN